MKKKKVPVIVQKAEQALKVAVSKTLETHRRLGLPIVIWRDGKVVRIPVPRIKSQRAA